MLLLTVVRDNVVGHPAAHGLPAGSRTVDEAAVVQEALERMTLALSFTGFLK